MRGGSISRTPLAGVSPAAHQPATLQMSTRKNAPAPTSKGKRGGVFIWSNGSRPSRGGTVIHHKVAVRVNGGFLILDIGAVLARAVRDHNPRLRGDL